MINCCHCHPIQVSYHNNNRHFIKNDLVMPAASRDGNGPSTSQLVQFDFYQLQDATNKFAPSFEIGSGSFGSVYFGILIIKGERTAVAIKRSNPDSRHSSVHRNTQFKAEVTTLPLLQHPNIVWLIGYCDHEDEKILVYEYASNGTVYDHLHKHSTLLSWLSRLLIAIRAAKGLCYLHTNTGCDYFFIHGDFKSSNVLLHGFEAKVSDFGLSQTCPLGEDFTFVSTDYVGGTFGRIDPKYCETRQLRRDTDVYAFGVLLLELVSRMPVLGEERYGEGMNLVKWAKTFIRKGNLKPITDPAIWSEISTKCLKLYFSIADSCLHERLELRPTMAEVVDSLESVLYLQKEHDTSLQLVRATPFYARMVDMFSFSSKARISGISNQSLEEYRFDDLRKATQNFGVDSLLGEGSFGKVFKGWVDKKPSTSTEGDKYAVAVKKFKHNSSSQGVVPGHDHWLAEMGFFGNMAHSNIIGLLGYSRDKSKHLLVYEYIPYKSFYQVLFPDAPDITEPLTWSDRLKTITGVACGLKHMHSNNYIHFNLHSWNILVPDDFDAKLGGLSLAKHCPEGEESHGTERRSGPMAFEDPEYKRTGVVTIKSDVFCLGMVILESLTGRHIFSFSDKIQLLVEDFKNGRIKAHDLMDPRLKDECVAEDVSSCFELAFSCVADKPEDRPSTEHVWERLRSFRLDNR